MTETLPARPATSVEPEPPLELTVKQRREFLAYIAANPRCSTREALARAGVKRPIDYRDKGGRRRTRNVELTKAQATELIDSSPELREDYEAARGRSFENIRAEIKRRAIDGVDEPVFHLGEVVGHIRKYSDRLLGAMAKANLPEYREQQRVEHEHVGLVTVVHERRLTLGHAIAFARTHVDVDVDVDAGDGPGAGARGELPAAREVLPEPHHD